MLFFLFSAVFPRVGSTHLLRLAHLSTLYYNCMFYLHLLSSSQCISFYFILFPFIRFYMNCFDFIFIAYPHRCAARCSALLSNVSYCIGLLFFVSILIPFHSIFYLSFCFAWLSGYSSFLFCFVSFYSWFFFSLPFSLHYLLFWLCHFWYVQCAQHASVHCVHLDMPCTHPLQKCWKACASDNQPKPFNNNNNNNNINIYLFDLHLADVYVHIYCIVWVYKRDLLNKSLLDWNAWLRSRASICVVNNIKNNQSKMEMSSLWYSRSLHHHQLPS